MNGFTSAEATILQNLIEQQHQLVEVQKQLGDVQKQLSGLAHLPELKDDVTELREAVNAITVQKDFYSTREVADLMGVTQHTVQVRWCAKGQIDCEKDPATGRWRIPGHEYDRLRRGGKADAD